MPLNSRYSFEICVETPAALNAAAAFADRIELCAGLDVGGLTPNIGMMKRAAATGVETHVLIRPRSGDFTMMPDDITTACTAIATARDLGLHGVVIGAEKDGALDLDALETLARAAAGLDIILHRVIDILDDPGAALETAITLGAKRILTSGGAPKAAQGIDGLNRLCAQADGRIDIMAGSGITSATLPTLMAQTPITSFHASCTKAMPIAARYRAFGFGDTQRSFDRAEAQAIATRLT